MRYVLANIFMQGLGKAVDLINKPIDISEKPPYLMLFMRSKLEYTHYYELVSLCFVNPTNPATTIGAKSTTISQQNSVRMEFTLLNKQPL